MHSDHDSRSTGTGHGIIKYEGRYGSPSHEHRALNHMTDEQDEKANLPVFENDTEWGRLWFPMIQYCLRRELAAYKKQRGGRRIPNDGFDMLSRDELQNMIVTVLDRIFKHRGTLPSLSQAQIDGIGWHLFVQLQLPKTRRDLLTSPRLAPVEVESGLWGHQELGKKVEGQSSKEEMVVPSATVGTNLKRSVPTTPANSFVQRKVARTAQDMSSRDSPSPTKGMVAADKTASSISWMGDIPAVRSSTGSAQWRRAHTSTLRQSASPSISAGVPTPNQFQSGPSDPVHVTYSSTSQPGPSRTVQFSPTLHQGTACENGAKPYCSEFITPVITADDDLPIDLTSIHATSDPISGGKTVSRGILNVIRNRPPSPSSVASASHQTSNLSSLLGQKEKEIPSSHLSPRHEVVPTKSLEDAKDKRSRGVVPWTKAGRKKSHSLAKSPSRRSSRGSSSRGSITRPGPSKGAKAKLNPESPPAPKRKKSKHSPNKNTRFMRMMKMRKG